MLNLQKKEITNKPKSSKIIQKKNFWSGRKCNFPTKDFSKTRFPFFRFPVKNIEALSSHIILTYRYNNKNKT